MLHPKGSKINFQHAEKINNIPSRGGKANQGSDPGKHAPDGGLPGIQQREKRRLA